MKKKVFLIDIDGVACEHAKAICERVNQEFNLNSRVEDVKCWAYDFGPISFVQAVKKYYPEEKFILSMEVTPFFNELLGCLKGRVCVKFATNRVAAAHAATRQWVNNNFGENYEVISPKCKICEDFDFLIDDHVPEIMCAADKGKQCFLFRRPWNDNEETKRLLKKYYSSVRFISKFSEMEDCFQ